MHPRHGGVKERRPITCAKLTIKRVGANDVASPFYMLLPLSLAFRAAAGTCVAGTSCMHREMSALGVEVKAGEYRIDTVS